MNYQMNRTEIVEVAPSAVEHIQGTYNGWTLAVDSVEFRYRVANLGHDAGRYDAHISVKCSRVNKDGRRGAQATTEDFHSGVAAPRAIPRWLLKMLHEQAPAWFAGELDTLFQGTDRTTIDTARGPILTWRDPR